MKIFKTAVCFLAFFFCFDAVAASAPAAKKPIYPTRNCGAADTYTMLKIVGFKNYPPFSWGNLDESYFSATGRERFHFEGFVVEPLKEALKGINIERLDERAFDNFEDAKKAILHGNADLIFTSYYIDEAKSGQDYIYPAYFGNPFIVISRQSKKIDIEDPSELRGLKGVVRREEEVEALIKGLLPTDTKLDVVDGPEAAFRALLSGEADFMITSPYAADAESRRFKIKKELYFGKKALRHIKYFAAFSKMSECRPYKDVFAEKFSAFFADKAEAEKRMHKYIQIWVDMHENDPPLEYKKPVNEMPAPQPQQPVSAEQPQPVPAG